MYRKVKRVKGGLVYDCYCDTKYPLECNICKKEFFNYTEIVVNSGEKDGINMMISCIPCFMEVEPYAFNSPDGLVVVPYDTVKEAILSKEAPDIKEPAC